MGSPGPVEGCSLYEISTLYVQPRHQGTGKGSGLLRACLRHVAQMGGEGAWLTVNAENDRALAFYGRQGFVDVGDAPFLFGNQAYENRVLTISVRHGSHFGSVGSPPHAP